MSLARRVSKIILPVLLVAFALLNLAYGQTPVPSLIPTRKPTNKPVHIYVNEAPVELTMQEKQGIVATLTVLLFILMAMDFTGPEVLFLIALMICCLAQILTMNETLSGKHF